VSIVEPGVTFRRAEQSGGQEGTEADMGRCSRARSSRWWVSMLSREPVIMPHYHWDIADPIGSTEVDLRYGDVFRTGAAAGPGTIESRQGRGPAEGSRRSLEPCLCIVCSRAAQGDDGHSHLGIRPVANWSGDRATLLHRVPATCPSFWKSPTG